MTELIPPGAWTSPSTARNRDPILAALKPRLPKSGLVLEIAAGAGEHAVHCAASLPHLQWQPTDPSPEALVSIAAWRDHAGLPNLLAPMPLDASRPESWPVEKADAIVSINMIHISPWEAAIGLMKGAARLLPAGGLLFLYGPYIESGVETVPSNRAFDEDLKRRNPAWGLRELDRVKALAEINGLAFSERNEMPANNLLVIFRKNRAGLSRPSSARRA